MIKSSQHVRPLDVSIRQEIFECFLHGRVDLIEKRLYTETTNTKTDPTFQAKLSLYVENWFVALKQHCETSN